MKGRVTIIDVARRAGVSTGTVSAVLNDRDSVRSDTRQRVLGVIRSLDYKPSRGARDLSKGAGSLTFASRPACLIVKEADNPFYSSIVLGAQEILEEEGRHLFVANSYGDLEKEGRLVASFSDYGMIGAIIAPVMHDEGDLTHLFLLQQMNFPFVLLERMPGLTVSSVSIDNVQAMQGAVSHLIELGHRRIVHVAGPPHTHHTEERIRGVQRAFSRSPLVYSDDILVEGGMSLEDGYRAGLHIFNGIEAEQRPTGVTCFNDLVALGTLRALSELGISVPEEVSVVGCDDIEEAGYLSVPMTTIRVPRAEIGRRAAKLLLSEIENGGVKRPTHIELRSELIVRATSATPAIETAVVGA